MSIQNTLSEKDGTGQSAVVLVGAGAVEGAWAPVLRALRTTISPGLPDDPDVGNLQMARLVHLLRFAQARNTEVLPNLLTGLKDLRSAIANEIRGATVRRELRARPNFVETMVSLRERIPALRVITTNWDFSVDEALASLAPPLDVLHLHGSIDAPDYLYLPTEISVDAYHSEEEVYQHARALRLGIGAVSGATELIIYGLSLSPLDAELCQLLWLGLEGRAKLEAIRVFDLQPDFVARRIEAILGPIGLPHNGVTRVRPEPVP
jgi:hypothetical protein